jgi:hypothetical protein
MKPGMLSITTEPSPLALSVYDAKLNVVARTVSPAQDIQLAPGIYFMRASRPLNPDLTALAKLTEGSSGSIHLTVTPSIAQRVLNFRAPVLELVSQPDPKLPLAPPETVWVRFVWLYDWDTAQLLPQLSVTPRFEPGQLVLELVNTHLRIVFVQIAGGKGPPLNVALPPAGFARPARCEIAISESPSGLVPKVRLSTAWANSAVQYMAQGYLDQAARVCDTAAKETAGRAFRRVLPV